MVKSSPSTRDLSVEDFMVVHYIYYLYFINMLDSVGVSGASLLRVCYRTKLMVAADLPAIHRPDG